jgi:hypothetical protein
MQNSKQSKVENEYWLKKNNKTFFKIRVCENLLCNLILNIEPKNINLIAII